MARVLLPLAFALALLTHSKTARADDDSTYRQMKFTERGSFLTCTAGFDDLFTSKTLTRLSNGLPTTIAIRLHVYSSANREQPVATTIVEHQVVYDLWDEVYVVRSRSPLGIRERRFRSRKRAVETITRITKLPVAALSRIAIGPHYFAKLVAELNPVSPQLRSEMRRWLSQPAGKSSLDSSSSFFGSFVSVFLNPKLDRADRIVRLHSQPFYRVEP